MKGYLLGDRLEYRAGAFDGHRQPATASGAGRVRFPMTHATTGFAAAPGELLVDPADDLDLLVGAGDQDDAVGLFVNTKRDSDPVDELIRRDAFQRACVALGHAKHAASGKIGGHGVTFLCRSQSSDPVQCDRAGAPGRPASTRSRGTPSRVSPAVLRR